MKRPWKKRQLLNLRTLLQLLSIHISSNIYITPGTCQTPLDIIQTSPRHHPETLSVWVFAFEKAQEEKAIAESKDSETTEHFERYKKIILGNAG